MAAINGTLIFLQKTGVSLVGQLDGTIGGSTDQLDATTKDSTAGAKVFVNGETTWQGTASALFDTTGSLNLHDIVADLKAGTQWTVKFGQLTTGTKFLTGLGYLKSWRWTGPKNALSNISIEFQGTAAITTDTN